MGSAICAATRIKGKRGEDLSRGFAFYIVTLKASPVQINLIDLQFG
jgi:hypothetical protein